MTIYVIVLQSNYHVWWLNVSITGEQERDSCTLHIYIPEKVSHHPDFSPESKYYNLHDIFMTTIVYEEIYRKVKGKTNKPKNRWTRLCLISDYLDEGNDDEVVLQTSKKKTS